MGSPNFYGLEDYHNARKQFVYKINDDKTTPENIASHRRKEGSAKKPSSGSMIHFVWQDYYQMGDEVVDSEHKDLFILADQLVSSINRDELIKNSRLIYQHVKKHFRGEEKLMKKSGFRNYKGHVREHNTMLEKLADMDQKTTNGDWKQNDIQEFMDRWGKHIIHSDMAFNAYQKEQELDTVE